MVAHLQPIGGLRKLYQAVQSNPSSTPTKSHLCAVRDDSPARLLVFQQGWAAALIHTAGWLA